LRGKRLPNRLLPGIRAFGYALNSLQWACHGRKRGMMVEDKSHDLRLYTALEDANRAASGVEAERRRMAALLESSVVEPLNLLLSQASAYEQTMLVNSQARMAVSVLSSLARQLLQQTRDLQANLHPTVLESLGLEPALETLANQEGRTRGLRINLALQRMRERLPPPVELVLFRAAQDFLDRATHHAHASQIIMRLERQANAVVFTLGDNGIGGIIGIEALQMAHRRIEGLGGTGETRLGAQGSLEWTIRFLIEPPVQLTERELAVLQLLAEGASNKAIAVALTISVRTVKFHLDNLYSKLEVNSRTEAAIYALRYGWVRRPPIIPG
jgi:DNA-binding CsgD family transcriptional regulator/signal transduction histidine kinase